MGTMSPTRITISLRMRWIRRMRGFWLQSLKVNPELFTLITRMNAGAILTSFFREVTGATLRLAGVN